MLKKIIITIVIILILLAVCFIPVKHRYGYINYGMGNECIGYGRAQPYMVTLIRGLWRTPIGFMPDKSAMYGSNDKYGCSLPVELEYYLI